MKTNFKFGKAYKLADQVESAFDKVQFKQVFETENGGVSILAFKSGQKLDTHLAPAEVMVYVESGEIEFTMNEQTNTLSQGEFLLMGADVPHSVLAKEDSKVVLIKVKP